jgi:hypothetical protein
MTKFQKEIIKAMQEVINKTYKQGFIDGMNESLANSKKENIKILNNIDNFLKHKN